MFPKNISQNSFCHNLSVIGYVNNPPITHLLNPCNAPFVAFLTTDCHKVFKSEISSKSLIFNAFKSPSVPFEIF